ncbi:MAG: hypothetical protein BMS9Abin17_1724 [Acidimicrobiia bacterium]|nr:MAG: hypothetical protein BMS9Abin17_1724 [Acidimicrobiia bacterium]
MFMIAYTLNLVLSIPRDTVSARKAHVRLVEPVRVLNPDVCVRGARYVVYMNKNSITVAGENLEDIEAALDGYDITFQECGCVNLSGSLPPGLSVVLQRALKTIEAEVATNNPYTWLQDAGQQTIRQLFLRIGAAYREHR